MKKWLLVLPLILLPLFSFFTFSSFSVVGAHELEEIQKPTGYVADYADMISADVETTLNQSLTQLEKDTSAEVVVVTINHLGEDHTIESYATELFEAWGIGKEKEDNGLLLLIAKEDRKMRIEVGYGLEPVVTDIEAAHIIQDILTPEFRSENYDGGATAAVERLSSLVRKEALPVTEVEEPKNYDALGQIFPFIIFGILWLVSILGRSKSWWAGGVIGAVIGIIIGGLMWIFGLMILGLIFDFVVSRAYNNSKIRGVRPPWWVGGGGFGSHGGGGFGGFGGGSSGGGGASGSW